MNRQLLLVEDETTLSLLLGERLEREGFFVKTCTSGEQGLAQALKGGFDILLLDIKLPGRNGFEVCRERAAASWHQCSHPDAHRKK